MTDPSSGLKHVVIYTDGACLGNPGPGGWGVVLIYGSHRREHSGGFRLTTNNRMELTAVIMGFEALTQPCNVTLISDSEYVVRAMQQGWPSAWKAKGWRRSRNQEAINSDLWERLLQASQPHESEFRWVRGHDGDPENENADRLATSAARRANLEADLVYEADR